MNRHSLVLTFAAAALAVAAGAALAAGPLDDALAAFKAGEYDKAVEIAGKVPADDPQRAKALYLVGEAELAREGWDAASAAFQSVLDAKKDSVPAMTGLGRAQAGKGDREAAEKTLRRAVELDGKDVAARRALGETLLAAERTDDARKELEAAWKLDGKDPLTARALVEAHLRGGVPDAASKVADAFAKTAPESATAHFLKGLVLDRRGKPEDAIEAYERSVKADDRYLDAHKNLAVLYTTSNRMYSSPQKVEKACEHAQRYVDLGGRDVELKQLLDQIKGFLDQMKKGGR
jgi:tetratricopeptide (TPR) repeat protein